jgi:hypothetical protein
MRRWTYPVEFLDALIVVGLRPSGSTPPALAREALNDMYRHELRQLRDRHVAGEVPRSDYVDRVIALRKKYWPLTLKEEAWERICSPEGADDATGADSAARDR